MSVQISIKSINVKNASEDEGTGKGIHGEFKFSLAVSRLPQLLPGMYKNFDINREQVSLAGGQPYTPNFSRTIEGWGHPLYVRFFVRELDGPLDADDTASGWQTINPIIGRGPGTTNIYAKENDLDVSATLTVDFKSLKASDVRPGQVVVMECQGNIPGSQWLDGNTVGGTVMLQSTYRRSDLTGVRWKVVDLGGGAVGFQCLGHVPGPQWLDGNTVNGTVSLAPETGGGYTGTRWRLHDVANGSALAFECLGNVPGPKWLDGNTVNGSVGLAPEYGGSYSGAVWHVFAEGLAS